MKTVLQVSLMTIILMLMFITDIPILPVQLVSDAEAILGVRRRTARRTAVVAYSAGAATASAAAAASQQQAAAAQQQAAAANQEAAAARQEAAAAQQQLAASQAAAGSAIPVGTVVQALPGKCTAVTVGSTQYQDCGGTFYRTAFQGNNLVYVVVDKPL